MSRTITSGNVTFVDLSDNRKLDAYIVSNLPTTQIYNQNTKTYTPDWSMTNLQLSADIYLDSKAVTNNDCTSIVWYKKIGTQSPTQIGTGINLTINGNQLSDGVGIITYICEATYNDTIANPPTARAEISFVRTDTGVNGSDGTGVTILGSYNTLADLQTAHKTGNAGDAYIVDGDLYVWDIDTTQWKNVGNLQGPAGKDGKDAKSIILSGDSQVFKVSKTNVVTPATITVAAQVINTSITTWSYSTNGGQTFLSTAPTGVIRSGNIVTITGTNITSNSIVIKASDGTIDDIFTVYKVSDGTDGAPGSKGDPAPIAFLTNENITFSANPQGQIATTTITSNVVAYNGTTKVTPTIGTITGMPTGMTITPSTISASNEVMLTITITNNSTLGSASNNMGVISVPVTSPVSTVLYLTWSKVNSGVTGVGIKSTTVAYGISDSVSTKPADITWQSTIPTVAEGKYLWTRTIIDYTDDAVADTVTYTYAKQGVKGDTGSTGTSVTVSSIQYQEGSSATIPPTSTWSNSVVAVTEGKFLWTKTAFSDGKIAYGVAKQGVSGKDGVGISSITIDYGVSDSAAVQPTTWQQSIPAVAEGKYLWTRTITDYTDASKEDTVAYVYAKQGSKGETGTAGSSVTVKSIKYQSGTSATTAPTGTWSDSVVAVADGNYLWTQTTFSDNKIAYGVAKQGQKGDQGIQGPKGNDAYTVILTNESHIFAGDISNATAGTAETQILAYNGSTQQSVTITSINGKTAATTDTDTGIAGLKFKCSALSGTSPKITFTCTTAFVSKSGSIPIVISIGGVSFTKMFTYSIAFKGSTGAQGSVGTPASLVKITPSSYYFKSTTGKDGTFTPDYIYLYPRFQTVTFSKWEYSINGGTSWVAASGANGLSIGTYNSVANTLRIARTSTLYTDAVTSISFRCVSSTASVYDTVSIAKIYDVVDLQIGGTNLLKSTATLDGILVGESTDRKLIARGGATIVKNYYNNLSAIKCNTIYQGIRFMADDFVDIFQIGDTYTFSVICRNLTGGTVSAHSYFIAQVDGSRVDPVTSSTLAIMENGETKTASCSFTINQAILDAVKNGHLEISIQCQGSSVFPTTGDSALYMWGGKLEKGNKATDWSPAPEDITSTTFQIYAPDGYVLSNKLESLTLQTFAYEGSAAITSATYAWSYQENEKWITIADETTGSLSVTKDDVIKTKTYRCSMTHNGVTYHSTATVQDISDVYDVMICVSDNINPLTGIYYWVVYALLYSEQGEADALLGPISINAPTSPVSGDYWYAIDGSTQTVTLKKYNGSAWVTSTDRQTYKYDWRQIIDGTQQKAIGNTDKVQIISCNSFTSNATFQCIVADTDGEKLARCNIHLTDTSDPIVSSTAPVGVKDGQLWMQTQTDGTFLLYIWDADTSTWKQLNADTKNVVHTTKPSSYKTGDLWVVESDSAISGYTKGTLLQSNATTNTFAAAHWSPSLKYESELSEVQNALKAYKQYMTVDSNGLHMQAKNADGTLSPFQALFTNTRLSFYQDDLEVAYISDNKLNIYEASIDVLSVEKKIQLQKFEWAIESNGSMSLIVNY